MTTLKNIVKEWEDLKKDDAKIFNICPAYVCCPTCYKDSIDAFLEYLSKNE